MKKVFDPKNDIVLTPSYISDFMCKIADVNSNSIVADVTAGDGSLLLSAHRHGAHKLIGVEYEPFMFNRLIENLNSEGVDVSKHILINGDGMNIPADLSKINILLLNPPYSADGKGLCFANYIMKQMSHGKAVILIQESAGSGSGLPCSRDILKHSTLKASVKLPKIFKGYAEVDVAIYVFECGKPHELSDKVLFLDMSNDGYQRSGRKSQKGIVKNVDHADERYAEALARIKGNDCSAEYYKKDSFFDTISLEGIDWTVSSHKKIDLTPTEDDFRKTIEDYLDWKCKEALGSAGFDMSHPHLAVMSGIGRSQNKQQEKIKAGWKSFSIKEIFFVSAGDVEIAQTDLNDNGLNVVGQSTRDDGVIGKTDKPARVFEANTITVDSFGNVYARDYPYKLKDDKVFSLKMRKDKLGVDENVSNEFMRDLTKNIANLLREDLQGCFSYYNKATIEKLENSRMFLPVREIYSIDYEYMEHEVERIIKSLI